jgi:hypothetical protein
MRKRAVNVLLFALACGALASVARAQTPDYNSYVKRAHSPDDMRRKVEEINRVADTEFDRGREPSELRDKRAQYELDQGIHFSPLNEQDKTTLAPPAEDAARFADFLARPDTGLVRVLPRDLKNFNGKLSIRGGGAYYSFVNLVHEYGWGTDIGLEQGRFAVGFAGYNFGALFDLGDMPLDEVTTDTAPVKFLASFRPPQADADARKIYYQLQDGYQDGWFVYRQRVPAVAEHTYVLRSVDYRRSDVLVAFRVVRKDEDGGVVLLWKMLKRFPEPHIETTNVKQ